METKKFFSLLKKITRKELSGFRRYLKRCHSGEHIALVIFDYLIDFHPKFDRKEKLQLEYVYQQVFDPEKDPAQDIKAKMENTLYDLYKWLKAYLIDLKLHKNAPLKQSIWLGILLERGMKNEFSRKSETFYHETQNIPFMSPDDVLPNWMANYYYRIQLSLNKPLTKIDAIRRCTETMTDCLDLFHLKMACEMSVLSKSAQNAPISRKKKIDIKLKQPGIKALKDVYAALLDLMEQGEQRHFERLESVLMEYGGQIASKELEGTIRYAYNIMASQSRRSDEVIYYERMHQLDKIGLIFGVYSQDGYLPSSAFGNIVTTACHSGDIEWAKEFIQKNRYVLRTEDQPVAIPLANAIVALESGKFLEVPGLIKNIDFKDILDNLRSKSLLLKAYYELDVDQDTILAECAKAEWMLRRSSATEMNRALLAFVLIIKLLATQKSTQKSILNRIKNTEILYYRSWLLNKASRYEARYAERKYRK